MGSHRFLAFDLGAESGRAVLGSLKDGTLDLKELYRFPNEPVLLNETLYWDLLSLYSHVIKGIREYTQRWGESIDGIGFDTWGVDFGLLARNGELLQNPVHYRDRRTDQVLNALLARIAPEELFQQTGMSLLPINTSAQLFSLRAHRHPVLEWAETFLMMPDLMAYFLTGRKACERTNAITTQLYNPWKQGWNREVLSKLDIPSHLMPELVDPGITLGELQDSVLKKTGLKRGLLLSPCTHDTASAVAAVPATGDRWAFLSSGTWSILGALNETVVTSSEAFQAGIFNELTLKSFFVCRNIMGLWLLQQARAGWQRQGQRYSYQELTELAEQSPSSGAFIDPDDLRFLAPEEMLQAIREYCQQTGQLVPQGVGEITRCILESLALAYRQKLEQLSSILGRSFETLHIVGGGSQNALLCQLTANAIGLPVVAGPAEATVAGNVMVQAYALGCVASPVEIRTVVRNSSSLLEYGPRDGSRWDDSYETFLRLTRAGGRKLV
ncbi:MAG: rhamnulokinase family protein [Terriglobia bacterium]